MSGRIEELKARLGSVRRELESERRSLPYADGPAYYQSVARIDRLREEEARLAKAIAEAEKGGEA